MVAEPIFGCSEIMVKSSYIEQGVLIPVFDQRGELPLLPFGNPIGFVPASRSGVYIELLPESLPGTP